MAARVSQEVVEALASGVPHVRASQEVVEVFGTGLPHVRASQVVVEALAASHRAGRCSQLVIEMLIPRYVVPFPPFYPILAGLTYSISWQPQFFNMNTETTPYGADIDIQLSNLPIHKFKLSYHFLRNEFIREIYWKNEFKKFAGFFEQLNANQGRFLFKNPDDYFVRNQVVGTTDGSSTVFGPIPRTYAGSTEPVGWVDKTNVVNVYLDGVQVSPARFFILQTYQYDQKIKFYDLPPAGKQITIDMNYFYYCKFQNNSNTFEKFLDRVWTLNEVNIQSCRRGM